jgi:hypothetical protein
MDKFLIKNQKKDASNSKTIRTNESYAEQKRPHIELDMNDIVADPGLRKPIDEFPHEIRDDDKRAYLQMGAQHVSDTTSSSLKVALDDMLARYGLSISRVRGQGYTMEPQI